LLVAKVTDQLIGAKDGGGGEERSVGAENTDLVTFGEAICAVVEHPSCLGFHLSSITKESGDSDNSRLNL